MSNLTHRGYLDLDDELAERQTRRLPPTSQDPRDEDLNADPKDRQIPVYEQLSVAL